MSDRFEIIATINHKTMTEAALKNLIGRGATILRLNGAFLDLPQVREDVRRFKGWAGGRAKILVDLPGFKLRLSHLDGELTVKGGTPFELKQENFNYPDFFNVVRDGQALRANDGLDRFVIREKTKTSLVCVSEKDCVLRRGKGIHIDGGSYRPSTISLSERDLQLIEASKSSDVDYLGLSFVYDAQDIDVVEKLIQGTSIECLPKIESKESLNSLADILKKCRMAIVDRGDLAAEIGIKNVWRAQRTILSMARLLGTRLILATQFLSHMIDKPLPSIAEVDSMYDLLNLGIDGIQLSDETSVGQYAADAVAFITDMVAKVGDELPRDLPERKASLA